MLERCAREIEHQIKVIIDWNISNEKTMSIKKQVILTFEKAQNYVKIRTINLIMFNITQLNKIIV